MENTQRANFRDQAEAEREAEMIQGYLEIADLQPQWTILNLFEFLNDTIYACILISIGIHVADHAFFLSGQPLFYEFLSAFWHFPMLFNFHANMHIPCHLVYKITFERN